MRFIIRELPYEKLLATGRLRYERDGHPTGAIESWRLTEAASGYHFLRIDLDAREAASGDSYLYHLTIGESGRPERLQYRFWGKDLQVRGNVLLEDGAAIATRSVNDKRFEEALPLPADYTFWLPTSIGLGMLAHRKDVSALTALSLNIDFSQPASAFSLFLAQVELVLGQVEHLEVAGQWREVQRLHIDRMNQERILWLDDHDWPLKMMRDDGLTSVETRYIRYR